jgi:hypothetical protein
MNRALSHGGGARFFATERDILLGWSPRKSRAFSPIFRYERIKPINGSNAWPITTTNNN